MSYNTEPTAEYVQKFGKRMEEHWGAQHKEDLRAWRLYDRREAMDTAEPAKDAGKVQIRPLRTGKPGIIIDRDAAALAQDPVMRCNPMDPADIEDRRHADGTLEPWLTGNWQESQVGEVWYAMIKDLRLYGRGVGNVFPLPRLWAGGEYQEIVDEWQAAVDARAEAESEDDIKKADKRKKKARSNLDTYLKENYPIRWRHVDARTFFPEWSDERLLPEAVEILEMSWGQIEADYDINRPEGANEGTQKVYRYFNWYWTMTVLPGNDKETPMAVHTWKHNLRMNPCFLMETNTVKEKGRRWKSALYDHTDMLEAENEFFSDIRHSSRRNTLAPLVFSINTEARGIEDDAKAGSRGIGEAIEYQPGEDVFLRLEEKVIQGPVSMVSGETVQLLTMVTQHNNNIALNPVEMGDIKAGQSAVGYATGVQQSQQRLDPYAKALRTAAKMQGRLSFRCVCRLNEEFPDAPDKVTVTSGDKYGKSRAKEIAVGPEDVDGWENLIDPRLSETLSVSRNAQMALATSALNLPLHPAVILEQYLNYENADDQVDRWLEWQVITQGILPLLIGMAPQRAGEMAMQPAGGDVQALAQNLTQLPPAAAQAMQGYFGGQMNGQANANVNQTGVMQPALSETAAQEQLV